MNITFTIEAHPKINALCQVKCEGIKGQMIMYDEDINLTMFAAKRFVKNQVSRIRRKYGLKVVPEIIIAPNCAELIKARLVLRDEKIL